MRFTLLDRIVALEPGAEITAVKNLSLAEEYLADHFPGFPVMPGVLMLQSMAEAGAWLVRKSEDYAHSVVVLSQAANVKYGQFVQPGQTLTVRAEIVGQNDEETKIKGRGTVEGRLTLVGRLTLRRYNLVGSRPDGEVVDEQLRQEMRQLFGLLYQPDPV